MRKLDASQLAVSHVVGDSPHKGNQSPACLAAVGSFRWALGFSNLFTGLVFVFTAALVVLLVVTLYVATHDGTSAETIAGAAGTIVSGSAATFVVTKMTQANKAKRQALQDVAKYCDTETHRSLTA